MNLLFLSSWRPVPGARHLRQSYLILIPPGYAVTGPTACFVCFTTPDHDRRRVVAGRLATDQTLIAARGIPADHTDRVELVDYFGNSEQLWHWAKRLAAEITIGTGENDTRAAVRQCRRQVHDRWIEKLRLVDRHDLRLRRHEPGDLLGRVHRDRLHTPAVMARDVVDPRVALVEVRFENLNGLLRDDRATNTADELFALSAEHHPANDFDPPRVAAREIAV